MDEFIELVNERIKERIVEDFTTESCVCPECGIEFARDTLVRGTPAYKFVGGKVTMK